MRITDELRHTLVIEATKLARRYIKLLPTEFDEAFDQLAYGDELTQELCTRADEAKRNAPPEFAERLRILKKTLCDLERSGLSPNDKDLVYRVRLILCIADIGC